MKATEMCFPVVLFIMLCEMVQTFKSVDEIVKCHHSNEQYFPVVPSSSQFLAGKMFVKFNNLRRRKVK